ncbi:metal-dependent hydrolase superfamily protein [Citrifermentans bemidjiense Bem]|uniref:Metal-dependent hydrolase superfamily protein n=1 Tax=Citrifermentans bemidjiense (strain ATCC BAA-1014 / DSM 16622 / JCM 12645 / Bem) TaxID=404380 RepID=B5EAM5_CITBB|nr:amidohydrolase family protein [Citrifermentans bemidjiense]ACH37334.1 metal-dependent hydrolase superfamily protein [Citrifermentans bemidjiense Bem]
MPNDTRKNIIDIHCHTAGIGAGESGCFVSPALMGSWKYWVYLRAFGVTEQELKREGDGLVMRRTSERLAQSERVASAVILAMDGVVDANGNLDRSRTEMFIPNEFVAKETAKYPNLLFGASINPFRPDAIERLERAAESGAVLLKWLPAIQHIDPADERLIPFYLKLKQLGLPLLTHTGKESSFTSAKEELGDPERLRLPLFLGVTVIAAHAASSGKSQGEDNHDRFLRLCREFPNLYADISALTQINRLGHLQRLLKQTELHGRLLYGTDMPLLRTPLVTPFAYSHVLPLRRMVEIARIANVWDRDVALKEALGVPELVFNNVQWMKDTPPLP